MGARFRRRYGASPRHLAGALATLAVCGLAFRRFFDADAADTTKVLIWLGASAIVHDLIFLPLYSLAGRILARPTAGGPGPDRRALIRDHIRVPAMLSGMLLLVFFPLILRRSEGDFHDASRLTQQPFMHRWLIATAILFGASAAVYAVRVARARRRAPSPP